MRRAMGWRLYGVRWTLCVRNKFALLALYVLVTVAALYGTSFAPQLPGRISSHSLIRTSSNKKQDVTSRCKDHTESHLEDEEATLEKWSEAEPRVDPKDPSLDQLFSVLEEKVPNLPIAYWRRYQELYGETKAGSCTKLSELSDLVFNNDYWQCFVSSNGTFQFFGAYLDVRRDDSPVVRVLGMVDRMEPIKLFCQLWFEDTLNPFVSPVNDIQYIWHRKWSNSKDGYYQPYLFTCPFPNNKLKIAPSAVSIVEKECDQATNILRVIFNKPSEGTKNFAVCVKGLDYYSDVSVRLVEWVELLNILGVDKIFFYKLHVHPNISKVLDYYEKQGKAKVIPITLPASEPNLPILQHYFLQEKRSHKRQNEVIPYNDCLYKNLYSYRYIILLDIDEVIMPNKQSSWIELVEDLKNQTLTRINKLASFYYVRNVYFLDNTTHSFFKDIPKYMHMMQHVYRSKNFTEPEDYVKGFFDTQSVVTLHNHFPWTCLEECELFAVKTTDAQLQHYRRDCVYEMEETCEDQYRKHSLIDTKIWRFKEPLVERVVYVLKTLGFLPSNYPIS